MIDKTLLDILVCPLCKANVDIKDEHVVCKKCGRHYPIKDNIPVMLINEAKIQNAK
jgi:uncharacterized protein YbaR (Trm112 family)